MSEVLIDDLNLNNIANSIRAKNGLVRTYKPREMAPAIEAFRNYIPNAHEYNVIVNQSPHQYITVRKYLPTSRTNHTGTFTVAEPYYSMDISIEPDIGYYAGTLNHVSPVIIDRDLIIEATPATYHPDQDIKTVYTNGYTYDGSYQSNWFLQLYSDSDCTKPIGKQYLNGRVRILYSDTGYRTPFTLGGISFLGTPNNNGSGDNGRVMAYATEVSVPNLDTSDWNDMRFFARGCGSLRKVTGFENWDLSNVSTIEDLFYTCGNLRRVDVSHWNMESLVNAYRSFEGCSSLFSLDLSGWYTPRLTDCRNMFSSCSSLRALDISELCTINLNSNGLSLPSNLRYLIMDKEEIKFINDGSCSDPNNYVKYLVPSVMVNEYKSHSRWSSRASRIFSVDDFTITHYNGEVFVSPNQI